MISAIEDESYAAYRQRNGYNSVEKLDADLEVKLTELKNLENELSDIRSSFINLDIDKNDARFRLTRPTKIKIIQKESEIYRLIFLRGETYQGKAGKVETNGLKHKITVY